MERDCLRKPLQHRGCGPARQWRPARVAHALAPAALLAGVALLAPPPAVADPADGAAVPRGVWMMQNGKAAVEFFACGASLCGRLVWGRPDQYPDGVAKDRRNPDPALRDRDLCGLTVIWGLERDGADDWTGGRVYDPSSGETYGARVHVQGPQRLRVRGYVGIPWFGRSQTWQPAPPDLPRCTPTAGDAG
ncbi:DUF2147 domain-containing protein [Rhodocista pekingensis]|uniref:DUF2147 domain-containing protein n=1 Tax=Rhodocista pekingensis TaxID=201185 RepID=A0ABW2KX29_9PROT